MYLVYKSLLVSVHSVIRFSTWTGSQLCFISCPFLKSDRDPRPEIPANTRQYPRRPISRSLLSKHTCIHKRRGSITTTFAVCCRTPINFDLRCFLCARLDHNRFRVLLLPATSEQQAELSHHSDATRGAYFGVKLVFSRSGTRMMVECVGNFQYRDTVRCAYVDWHPKMNIGDTTIIFLLSVQE